MNKSNLHQRLENNRLKKQIVVIERAERLKQEDIIDLEIHKMFKSREYMQVAYFDGRDKEFLDRYMKRQGEDAVRELMESVKPLIKATPHRYNEYDYENERWTFKLRVVKQH